MKIKLFILFMLLSTFELVAQNKFSDVTPGKINVYNTLNNIDLPTSPFTDIVGIKNLVTTNFSTFYAYTQIVGQKNEVISNSGLAAVGNFGIGKSENTYNYIGITGGTGIYGLGISNNNATGVYGEAQANSTGDGLYYGVRGRANSSSATARNYAIYGETYNTNSTSYAGYFYGKVHINGTLSKSAGTFKIDHPLDPQNKYLSHSFVESPDMMNIYNGNIVTDQNGKATVTLPDYFEALNMDFRYQLTTIESPAQTYIFEKIKRNKFVIATDKPNVEVSWQVTGVRNDAYAKKNRIVPEEDKPASEKGKYLNADAFGLPREESLHAIKSSEVKKK